MLPFYITKSLLAIKNEISNLTPIGETYDHNTTLNHKYDLFKNISPEGIPKIRYYGIGINGCRYVDEHNSLVPYVPKITDMDLYTPIPFRCVPVSNDLSAAERTLYRMRVMQTFGGIDYFCYYLKVITISTPDIVLAETDLTTGDETILVLDNSNLYPIPDELVVVDSLDVNKEGSAYVEGILTIMGFEVLEAINVIYEGDLTKAQISEIGLYSGEDKEVTSDITYTESIYTQLNVHKCMIAEDFSSQSINRTSNVRLLSSANFII